MALRVQLFTFIVLVLHSAVYSQEPKTSRTDYINFVLDANKIWLLTRTGEIRLVDSQSAKLVTQPIQSDSVLVLAKDHLGNIIVGTLNQQIKRFDPQYHSWSIIATYTGKLTGIVFDSKNDCLAITDKGILDTKANAVFFPDSMMYMNDQIRKRTKWFGTPTYMLDNEDRIWIGFGYGEWGGDLFIFDVATQKYLLPQLNKYQINLNPIQAFVQGNKNVYMTTGMAHFFTHGSLVDFTDISASVVLQSESHWKDIGGNRKIMESGEYIGPATYNNQDHCIYFYSQHGIFKGNPTDDLSTMSKWTLVIKPQLQWTGGQRDAVGPAMNVLKMEFSTDGTLLFLTEYDGLGIYDGKKVRFIK